MRTSKINLIAILMIGAAVLAAKTASAGGFSFGGGGGGGGGNGGGHGGGHGGGFKIGFGGGNHNNHNSNHHGHHHNSVHHKYYHHPVKTYYQPTYVVYDKCYHPYYSYCFVYPGDTWYTISKRCYGYSHLWKHIATYNGLSLTSSALVAGQQIQLPVVNANGTLAASNAPAPAHFAPQSASFGPQGVAPQGQPMPLQNVPMGLGGSSPAPQSEAVAPSIQPSNSTAPAAVPATIRTISDEPKRPIVTIGSTLTLDGESLGSEKGIVRLRVSGMALPVEVMEWSNSSAKIQLPKMDLAGPMKAELEVVRADGSLASKSMIELTPAATRLALGN
ncbi:MAG: LysM peptidoglycan-binding domain-containing protein [Pirellulales bacterium]